MIAELFVAPKEGQDNPCSAICSKCETKKSTPNFSNKNLKRISCFFSSYQPNVSQTLAWEVSMCGMFSQIEGLQSLNDIELAAFRKAVGSCEKQLVGYLRLTHIYIAVLHYSPVNPHQFLQWRMGTTSGIGLCSRWPQRPSAAPTQKH